MSLLRYKRLCHAVESAVFFMLSIADHEHRNRLLAIGSIEKATVKVDRVLFGSLCKTFLLVYM